MIVPTAYAAGYAEARKQAPEIADLYLKHVCIGDPLADAALASMDAFGKEHSQRWIRVGIEQGLSALNDAPDAVRALFAEADQQPVWFEPAMTLDGCRAFHRHAEMFLGAFVGAVLIEGFSTLISKSFCITGRLVDQGVRRLKQNNLHLLEIFMPGGLDRRGDGWKLSVRIRLVHARVRQLLSQSPEWDTQAWGTPISAAHIGYSAAAFSGLLLERAQALGVRLNEAETASFMLAWRRSAQLMGVPDALLAENKADALRLLRIGSICEPPPELESIIMANSLINCAPVVAGVVDIKARRAMSKRIYGISRALIGDPLADALQYPPHRAVGALKLLQLKNRADQLLNRMFPAIAQRRRAGQFKTMLGLSFSGNMDYKLAEHLYAEKDKPH